MAELSEATKKLISRYEFWKKSLQPKEDAVTIHVDEVALSVAAFYEQIRTIVDWKEEHLMRRAAIIRKLTRRLQDFQLGGAPVPAFAEDFVLDLIRGGYFPNNKIEESKISDVQKTIDKYVFILKNNLHNKKDKKEIAFYNELLEIASCEIEEKLAPSIKEMALIDYMFEKMKERIKVSEMIYQRNILERQPLIITPGLQQAVSDKDAQIYIAVQQALFKLDEPIISYNLIRYKYPNWDNYTEQELLVLSGQMHQIIDTIKRELSHPIGKKFYAICEKYDTAYLLIGDILASNNLLTEAEEASGEKQVSKELQEPSLLEGHIRTTYAKRLEGLKATIQRAAIYSTVSIFITKILSLLLLEYLLTLIFKSKLHILFLMVDVLVPTLLMVFLVSTIKPPSKKNINLVIVEIMKIFYQKEKTDSYEVKVSRKKGLVTRLILSFAYLFGACISFGSIFWVFWYFRFPTYSIIINIVFIALILFAGTAIQRRSKELTIEEESGGFLSFFTDILFLPLTGAGRWMSNKWKRYNAITAFLNAAIDMPFSMFVEFLERWRGFIKERKEELR